MRKFFSSRVVHILLIKSFIVQETKHEVTKVVPICINGRKKNMYQYTWIHTDIAESTISLENKTTRFCVGFGN